MAEVNTIIITTAVATIVALAAVIFCMQPNDQNNTLDKISKDKAITNITTTKSKKKANKANKAKAKKTATSKVNTLPVVVQDAIIQPEEEEDDDDDDDDDIVIPIKKRKEKKVIDKTKLNNKNKKEELKPDVHYSNEIDKHIDLTINHKISTEPANNLVESFITAQPQRIPIKKESDEIFPSTIELSSSQIDDWAVVEKKSKAYKKSEDDLNEELIINKPIAPIETDIKITEIIKVDSKKVGSIIGPKGATKIALQNASGAEIILPKANKESTEPVEVTIIGAKDNVVKAKKAVIDLVTKGYTALLAGEDFRETQVTVHHAYLPEIIGTKGATVKTIQDKLNVRITIPNNLPGNTTLKIGVAGLKDDVIKTKALIKELVQFHHTEVTHPGVIHEELDNIASHYYNYIIGPKGSEIKHIQANFKVSIYIPNEYSLSRNILIVGLPSNVDHAKRYILKIIENIENGSFNKKTNTTTKSTTNTSVEPGSSVATSNPVKEVTVDDNVPDSIDNYIESRKTEITFGDLITTAKHVPSNGIIISSSNNKDDEESDNLGPKPAITAPTSGWVTAGTSVVAPKFTST